MSLRLQQFCDDVTGALRTKGAAGLDDIAARLKLLLRDPAFVAETFQDYMPHGKRVLFHDPMTGVYVQAHVQAAEKRGKPHSHGASWAVYGNARGHTKMTEWRRVNPVTEDHAVLEAGQRYILGPGDARPYPPGMIHSTEHPEKAWVIRITGTDLDRIPRYHFDPAKDRIVEPAAE
jgi:hypothetical protein